MDTPELAPAPSDPTPGAYRNLWVPLIVVPFLVVGVIALVFVFFGAIRGEDASMEENLRLVVEGGANERKQAAVSLSVQVLENSVALADGREPEWEAPGDILPRLQKAWEALPSDDNPRIRLVVAQLGAQFGDPEALAKLAEVLAMPQEDDPEGELRVYAMLATTWLEDERAAGLLIPFLQHTDPFLRQSAAGALQLVGGEDSLIALRGLLGDPSLELRGQAAISLARLGDPSGAAVLRELVQAESFAAETRRAPGKFSSERSIHRARIEGVRGLARLGMSEDRGLLESLAADDSDPAVRETAMLALAGRLEGGPPQTEPSAPAPREEP